MPLTQLMTRTRARTEQLLDQHLPPETEKPQALHAAMRHSSMGGGKRIRPFLVYTTGALFGVSEQTLDPPALAVELIHIYSLIHDDLPAMDDDELRRGKPTCHIAFGEATAILAGDTLQALAFATLAKTGNQMPEVRAEMIAILADASGSGGMAGGQAIDLDVVGQSISIRELERMHSMKTGALIRAAIQLGALCGRPDETVRRHLDGYGAAIGLAFQIQDDILDAVGHANTLGKKTGADARNAKPNFVTLLGIDGARQRARELIASAEHQLNHIDRPTDTLRQLAHYIVSRSR